MARMLDDLLDSSRIGLGKVSVQMEPIAVQQLLNEVTEEQRVRIAQAALSLELHIDDKPCSVHADHVRLRQVVDNLFSNAIKFTPAGGTIHLSFAREGALGSISVRDTGVGFDEQFATRMFEPFAQAEQDRARPRRGLGLGLAIASRLAKLQGGTLSGESAGISRGANFTLRLPLAEGQGAGVRRSDCSFV
jgi:signal transduction histidine kinase